MNGCSQHCIVVMAVVGRRSLLYNTLLLGGSAEQDACHNAHHAPVVSTFADGGQRCQKYIHPDVPFPAMSSFVCAVCYSLCMAQQDSLHC